VAKEISLDLHPDMPHEDSRLAIEVEDAFPTSRIPRLRLGWGDGGIGDAPGRVPSDAQRSREP